MDKEIKKLKSKQFWLGVLRKALGWLIPKLKDWIDKMLTDIEWKLASKELKDKGEK